MKKIIIVTLMLVSAIISFVLLNQKLLIYNSEKNIDKIRKDYIKDNVTVKEIDFNEIKNVNEDVIAWIKIPNTTVNYPILQSKIRDNYYLDRDIKKIKNKRPGSIYINSNNTSDFSDNNTIIYGHNFSEKNTNGKTIMFSDLKKYLDKDFFDQNNEIIIYTPSHTYTYEIFAAVTYNNILIPSMYDFDNENDYESFINSLYNKNFHNNNYSKKKVTRDDKIITLSTCTIDYNYDYRYLIVAALVNEEQ